MRYFKGIMHATVESGDSNTTVLFKTDKDLSDLAFTFIGVQVMSSLRLDGLPSPCQEITDEEFELLETTGGENLIVVEDNPLLYKNAILSILKGSDDVGSHMIINMTCVPELMKYTGE